MNKGNLFLFAGLFWIAMVLLGGLVILGIWNFAVIKVFDVSAISYYQGLLISAILSLVCGKRRLSGRNHIRGIQR